MNETYLIVTGLLMTYCIIQISTGAMDDYGFRGFSTFILSGFAVIMFVTSGFLPIGDSLVEYKKASNTRVGDELVIQATGFPTQNIVDIRFIDKPVRVVKTISTNAWGGGIRTTYSVVTDIPEKQ
jgi:hypothetical protein